MVIVVVYRVLSEMSLYRVTTRTKHAAQEHYLPYLLVTSLQGYAGVGCGHLLSVYRVRMKNHRYSFRLVMQAATGV